MDISMLGGYYTIDIRRLVSRNHKDVPYSGECSIVTRRLKEKVRNMTNEQKVSFFDKCMTKCMLMYNYGKANNNFEITHRSAVVANSILDAVRSV